MRIYETEILKNITLTTHQQTVLVDIFNAPPIPDSEHEKKIPYTDDNSVAARDMLVKLGLIEYDEKSNFSSITEDGEQIMKEDGLLNDDGTLTDKAHSMLTSDSTDKSKQPNTGLPGDDFPPTDPINSWPNESTKLTFAYYLKSLRS